MSRHEPWTWLALVAVVVCTVWGRLWVDPRDAHLERVSRCLATADDLPEDEREAFRQCSVMVAGP